MTAEAAQPDLRSRATAIHHVRGPKRRKRTQQPLKDDHEEDDRPTQAWNPARLQRDEWLVGRGYPSAEPISLVLARPHDHTDKEYEEEVAQLQAA